MMNLLLLFFFSVLTRHLLVIIRGNEKSERNAITSAK